MSNDTPWHELKSLRISFLHNRARPVIFFALLVFVFFYLGQTFHSGRFPSVSLTGHLVQSNPVLNSTLGFEQIIAIVLPDSERKSSLLAAANATDLNITIFDAAVPEKIPKDDVPKKWGNDGYKPAEGVLGCLMSHVYVWRKVINENMGSALVMESDSDWDMRIKQSMVGLSEGAKAVADFPFKTANQHSKDLAMPPSSPYGDNWDILWIGHCGSNTNGDGRSYAYNDSSAANSSRVWAPFAKMAGNYHRENGTRLVFQLRDVVCTVGYAISNRGAHKMNERFKSVNQPVDLEMGNQCKTDPELVCLATYPQILSMAKGLPSNINKAKGDKKEDAASRKVEAGIAIQISARKNAALGVASQHPETWVKEWGD